jgi:hypothetical protein
MSDQIQEILDVPREFLKDGIQFIHRAQKRMFLPLLNRDAQTQNWTNFARFLQRTAVSLLRFARPSASGSSSWALSGISSS